MISEAPPVGEDREIADAKRRWSSDESHFSVRWATSCNRRLIVNRERRDPDIDDDGERRMA